MSDLQAAKARLETEGCTCVLQCGERTLTSHERGVAPLLSWLDGGEELCSFSAADKVVGRATAFLYVLLGVRAVYAVVISRAAADVLKVHGIAYEYGQLVPSIINRRKDGICPFEEAVISVTDPDEALAVIRRKVRDMSVAYSRNDSPS